MLIFGETGTRTEFSHQGSGVAVVPTIKRCAGIHLEATYLSTALGHSLTEEGEHGTVSDLLCETCDNLIAIAASVSSCIASVEHAQGY